MSIRPNPSFPLLASDQEEVIGIFLGLMKDRDRPEREPEPTNILEPHGKSNKSEDSFFPGDAFDYE